MITIPGILFTMPNAPPSFINGIITDWKGITIAATKKINKKLLSFPLVLTSFHAAMELITTIPILLATVIINEFQNAFGKLTMSHTLTKFVKSISFGQAAASINISEKAFTEFIITK